MMLYLLYYQLKIFTAIGVHSDMSLLLKPAHPPLAGTFIVKRGYLNWPVCFPLASFTSKACTVVETRLAF